VLGAETNGQIRYKTVVKRIASGVGFEGRWVGLESICGNVDVKPGVERLRNSSLGARRGRGMEG